MNKLIDGKRYNTETAEVVVLVTPNMHPDVQSESLIDSDSFFKLMRKSTGEYFIYKHERRCDWEDPYLYWDDIEPMSSLEDALTYIYDKIKSDYYLLKESESSIYPVHNPPEDIIFNRSYASSRAVWELNINWLVDLFTNADFLDLTSSVKKILGYIGEIENSISGYKKSVSIMIPYRLLEYIDSRVDETSTRTDVIVGMLSELKARSQMDFHIDWEAYDEV